MQRRGSIFPPPLSAPGRTRRYTGITAPFRAADGISGSSEGYSASTTIAMGKNKKNFRGRHARRKKNAVVAESPQPGTKRQTFGAAD